MTRRDVLTAVELTLVTTALAAAVPILAHAANWGAGWGAPALAGAVVLIAMLAPASLALLLIGAWRWATRDRDQPTVPPSAHAPLWPAHDELFEDYAVEYMRQARQATAYAVGEAGATGRHAAPLPPRDSRTQPMPTVITTHPSWDVGNPAPGPWSAPIAAPVGGVR